MRPPVRGVCALQFQSHLGNLRGDGSPVPPAGEGCLRSAHSSGVSTKLPSQILCPTLHVGPSLALGTLDPDPRLRALRLPWQRVAGEPRPALAASWLYCHSESSGPLLRWHPSFSSWTLDPTDPSHCHSLRK